MTTVPAEPTKKENDVQSIETAPMKSTKKNETIEEGDKKRSIEETSRTTTDMETRRGDGTAPAPAASGDGDGGESKSVDSGDGDGKKSTDTSAAATTEVTAPPPKKAKIAMPPAVSAMLTDVDEYTLDAPPTSDNADDSKIETPNIILFGLHPLVKEPPLKKLCENYGTIKSIGVRSAFASRYGHVEFASVEEAKVAYKALNGAKLLHKAILVQPTQAQAQTAK